MGRSGSPSRKSTITSQPTRGCQHRALALAREGLAHAHPARAWLLREPVFFAIPVEAEPHAPDLRARRPPDVDLRAFRRGVVRHEGGLRAHDARPRRGARRPEARCLGRRATAPPRTLERAGEGHVAPRVGLYRHDTRLLAAHVELGDEVLALVAVLLVLDAEDRAGAKHSAQPVPRRVLGLDVVAVEPRLRERFAQGLPVRVAPRPAVLEEVVAVAPRLGPEVERGFAPVVVAEAHRPLAQPGAELERADVAPRDRGAERVERVEPGLAVVAVGDDEQAEAGAVLDVIAEALVLEQARDEGEVALVVLDAVGADANVVDARGVGDAPREFLRGGRERGREAEVVFDEGAGVEGEVRVALEDGVDDLARGLLRKMRQRVRCCARTSGGMRTAR